MAAVEKSDGHIDSGILGAKYLLNALIDNGRADVAYRIASQTDLPSWGWWIEQGATTLWEQWNGERVAQPHHVRRHQRVVLQGAGRHQPRSRSSPASSTSSSNPGPKGKCLPMTGKSAMPAMKEST